MAKQARAFATRELIVQAAGVVFARQNYAKATLGDVIAEASVTQGALYFHFESKKAVALEVISRQHELFMDVGKTLMQRDLPGVAAMVTLSRELAQRITTNPLVQAGLRLSTESADTFVDTASGPYEDWIAAAEVFIRRAIDDGDIAPHHDSSRLAAYVIATFTGVQSLSQARTGWADILERLEEMWVFLLGGVATSPERASAWNIHSLLND